MRKVLISLLTLSSVSAFASNYAGSYTQFQRFDNQVSIGYGRQEQISTAVAGGNNNTSSSNIVNLEAERLLNSGIWIDVNANTVFGQGPTNLWGTQQPVQSNYGMNGKLGYAFSLANQHLLITPYGTVGLNNNGIVSGVGPYVNASNASSGTSTTTANQFYYTAGAGARLEYRINQAIELYVDQNALYNWDQTSYADGIQPQNFYQFVSTVGAKFNLTRMFQLGVRGFYQDDQPAASSGTSSGVAFPQPQSGWGGLVTVGLTY